MRGEGPAIELCSIELSGECLRNGQPDIMGRTTWQAIVELPRFRVPADPAAVDAARSPSTPRGSGAATC